MLEIEGGAWFFGDDEDFLPGKREQTPIFAAEVHLVRRFRPGFWASLEANFFAGGGKPSQKIDSSTCNGTRGLGGPSSCRFAVATPSKSGTAGVPPPSSARTFANSW